DSDCSGVARRARGAGRGTQSQTALLMSTPPPAIPDPNVAPIAVSNRRRWTIVWLLFTASLINYFDRQTLSFAMPLIAKDFHLNETAQGLLMSSFFCTYTYL